MRGRDIGPHLFYSLQDKKMGSFYKKQTPHREQSYIKEFIPKIRRTEIRVLQQAEK